MDSRLFFRLGWLLFALGWVPFAGIFIGLIGFPSGSYAWSELPTLARYSIIATGILFSFSMFVLFGSQLADRWANRRIKNRNSEQE